ncbi:SGNH/GDSL hydrolase family protein [Maribacter sp. 2308TA10-17]|uniref:SGNH/GDSL hydrolase family protein n=1 Tax=Maribacter sp. 2308TA10-17 TaxID=3386276 RepID=UPI0039BCBF37
MKKALRNFFRITVPTLIVLLLLLELFFRVVIPAADPPMDFFDEKELIYRFDTNSKKEGVFTIGKAAQQRGQWRINNYGWNSPIDYTTQREKPLIAIIGDSYIEAYQVDVDKSYPSLLRNELKSNYDVYSFGKSGAPLSEYLNYSRYIKKHFNPDTFIFNVVHNDFDENISELNPEVKHMLTLNINDSTITENLPKPNKSFKQYNWKKRMLNKSAFIRYLYINLHIDRTIRNFGKKDNGQKKFNANIEVTKAIENKGLIIQSVDYILAKLYEENPGKRIIFVIDAPRNDIYNNTLENSSILFLNEILEKHCSKYNFEYFDLTQPMNNDYKKNQIQFNSELDGHWNEYGHDFISKQIRTYLKTSSEIATKNTGNSVPSPELLEKP